MRELQKVNSQGENRQFMKSREEKKIEKVKSGVLEGTKKSVKKR